MSTIKEDSFPKNIVIPASATREEKVRMIWEHFKAQEVEEARERKAIALIDKGLPPSTKRGKSRTFLGKKAGMSGTSYANCDRIIRYADCLRGEGRTAEADRLLYLLNEKSINRAAQEMARIKRRTDSRQNQE